jgi:hypothetical protein
MGAQTTPWAGILNTINIGEPDMPKAARISAQIPASTVSSEKSESHQLVSIAIFSGIGLLASLIAILMGMQGAWY